MSIVTSIIGKRKITKFNGRHDQIHFNYHIQECVYHSFSGIKHDGWNMNMNVNLYSDSGSSSKYTIHNIFNNNNDNNNNNTLYMKPQLYSCSFKGMTCDGHDEWDNELQLPELNIGDYICWNNMGAYSISSSSNFNDMTSTKLVIDDESSYLN
jgi:hypothetical protein